MENAISPIQTLLKKVNVSPGTVHVRMKKMEQLGMVKASQLNVDYAKLGFDIMHFLHLPGKKFIL